MRLGIVIAAVLLLMRPDCRMRGDHDYDGEWTMADVFGLLSVIYAREHMPPGLCLEWADVNEDGYISMADVSYLLAYLYQGGPAPNNLDTCCPVQMYNIFFSSKHDTLEE